MFYESEISGGAKRYIDNMPQDYVDLTVEDILQQSTESESDDIPEMSEEDD